MSSRLLFFVLPFFFLFLPTTAKADEGPWTVLVETAVGAPWLLQLEAGARFDLPRGFVAGARIGTIRRTLGTDLIVVPEAGWSWTGRSGLTFDTALGLGLRQQFVRGDLYRVSSDGSIEDGTDWGLLFGITNIKFHLGYDFSTRTDLPLRVTLGPRFQGTFPQWDQVGLEAVFGLSVHYRL